MSTFDFGFQDFLACCGSTRFAKEMASASPFPSLHDAVLAARGIWFDMVDVNGWLEAFSAHPQIGKLPSSAPGKDNTHAQWSKGEQSTAFATATNTSLQELSDWNAKYREKFGFVFLICASGRSTAEILAELKKRYSNRHIEEFQNAANEQMKITELRLAKLFSTRAGTVSASEEEKSNLTRKVEGRIDVIGGHLTPSSATPPAKPDQSTARTRPPITTHVLDVSQGCPASNVEVRLEMWKGMSRPTFGEANTEGWVALGHSATDKDGRSGKLVEIVDDVNPGIYRISFNTGKYCPGGFFPYVSVVFDIQESQKKEHFHVPIIFSPYSFTTYRGS
ncbi:hypothetical protein MLD38_023767 [Melastoma candidum]|uniref:Uncharacterized protein n=1 Tax=Melastoma candidum TaxID=119954 RepID=A0ACB9NT52_9MYRT|nr:hypothetical protein MLD38_023767 [Melastoma candidum]